ncbi:MAG: DUF2442 domain-containing protein [Desulfamplus sp.]
MYKGVISVKVIDDYKLLLCFDNGEKKIFDAMPILSYGRFKELNDLNLFKKVRVSFDTVEWDNGLDLDPEYLYAKSTAI